MVENKQKKIIIGKEKKYKMQYLRSYKIHEVKKTIHRIKTNTFSMT